MDWLLLLMVLIWGTNYTIIKSAFAEIDPQAFNALRMMEASSLMLATMVVARRVGWNPRQILATSAPITRKDWIAIAGLGLVGQCVYQYCFIGGVARTSVANSALILGTSPVVITVTAAALRLERVTARHWIGVLLSLSGIYLAIGRGARLGGESVAGDLMMAAAVGCWTIYTIGARPLMQRHSPVGVTALAMVFGTAVYVPLCVPALTRVPWGSVHAATWAAIAYSAAAALCLAYVIWYAAVRELGSARASIYSNLLPVVAMATAYLWLGEPLSRQKLIGAGLVVAGVALTRGGGKIERP